MTLRQTGGNGGTFTIVFVDADDLPVDPDGAITVNILDPLGTALVAPETIALDDDAHTDVGTFQYQYTPPVPTETTSFYDIVASGAVDGLTQLVRKQVIVDKRTP